jgi:pimeloyl-ACP methyl ester carboxylesterase
MANGSTAQEARVPDRARASTTRFGGQMVVYEADAVMSRGSAGARDRRRRARDFRDQILAQKSFHVVAVDLPGFGQSDRQCHHFMATTRVLKRVAGRFLRSPFVLVGHSMGAVVSLRYAATYPEDVRRLVVIDAPGVLHRYSVTSQYLAHLGLEFVPPAAEPSDWLTNLARKLLAPLEQLHLNPQIILWSPQLREALLGADPAKIAGLATVSEDTRQDLPKVRAETLIVWGARDTLAPLRTGKVLALKLPRAQLAVIERAAHVSSQSARALSRGARTVPGARSATTPGLPLQWRTRRRKLSARAQPGVRGRVRRLVARLPAGRNPQCARAGCAWSIPPSP